MRIPKVIFSKWYAWNERDSIGGRKDPGVYIMAKFSKAPPSKKASPLTKEIIYVGETCGNTPKGRMLKERWGDFNRTVLKGAAGHSGGWTYREHYGNTDKNLYVAAFPVSISKMKKMANRNSFIRYVERATIWNYIRKHGCSPSCNTK